VLAQVQDEEDAEEGVCPAEELWDEAFLPRHRGECHWPLEAGLALLLDWLHNEQNIKENRAKALPSGSSACPAYLPALLDRGSVVPCR